MHSVITTLALALAVAAQRHAGLPPPSADPYADPKHDYTNPLRYIANNTLTAISVGARALLCALRRGLTSVGSARAGGRPRADGARHPVQDALDARHDRRLLQCVARAHVLHC